MRWGTERTEEFEEWWESLTGAEKAKVDASIVKLEEIGPSARRPFVDTVKGSRHPNMKEVRPTRDDPRLLRFRSEAEGGAADRR